MSKKKKAPTLTSLRGVADMEAAQTWLSERGIEDIECIVPDLAGVADDPDVRLEGDDGRAKQAYASAKLAKTFSVPEENRHETVRVKVVLKRRAAK